MAISAILFDLEGVLLQAKTHEVLAGAVEIINGCRAQNLPFGIVTNNTVKRPSAILDILKARNLSIEPSQLLTPLQFLSSELEEIHRALVIGSENLQTFVREHNVEVCDSPDVDAVICGGSYQITNHNLDAAYSAIANNKSRFLCLHRNRVFNDAKGVTRPDIGSIVVGLEYATGQVAKTLGKPSPDYFRKATQSWGLKPEQILLISDDPLSDLEGGRAIGFQTAFLSTGKYSKDVLHQLEKYPDYMWLNLILAKTEISTMIHDDFKNISHNKKRKN